MKTPLIALCVGHSRKIAGLAEGGAVTHDGTMNEWRWNTGMAELIAKHLHAHSVRSVIVSEYEGAGYGAAMRWLASHLKGLGVTAAIELHFNSADNENATGHEWLYWHRSKAGERLAQFLEQEMNLTGTGIKSRGAKPIHEGRGAEFLRLTHCPAVIAEPFFGSNPRDWKAARLFRPNIARAIAEGILEFLD